jgi:tRNA(fMet)-specific endonuclease VapC
MLDTNICSFIMREKPLKTLQVLQSHVESKDRIVISAITYSELKFGSIGKKASAKMPKLVGEFLERIHSVMPWDKAAVDATTEIKKTLAARGTPISNNDAAIAGNAVALNCTLVTNNTREFQRIETLTLEDWSL